MADERPGMDESDRRQLDRVVALVRDVIGSNTVGAYLFGSAVVGGLRPRSDLDVLVVSKRPMTEDEKQELVHRILPISWQQTAEGMLRGIELTVVVQSDVRPWRYPPNRDFQYGGWLRLALERGEARPWAAKIDPDLASLITQALAANTPLLGPPPADVLDPVPFGDVRAAIVAYVDQWTTNIDTDTRNGILALARIWSALETSDMYSKDAAATWALLRLPDQHKPVLARARSIYLGEREDEWDDLREAVRRYVAYVVGEIGRVYAGPRT
ncbi:MAG: aminoglycoside adenylyltransferase family protein [Thermoleophilia bacterium]|nr:aminoglycoside adenylyltransferase family protein [Thermoleophilia bacterium]MDH5282020.1 aminoglycoside adenylyltransferase family protein [Thermoleophilia bacterium]